MIVKRGDCKILNVFEDKDHNIDDEGTRKALAKTQESVEKSKTGEAKPSVKNSETKDV